MNILSSQNFYIADTHFDHNNIIKFDNRPFFNQEDMNSTLIKNWNKVVHKNDNVFVLGDFCWSKEERWIELLSELKGVKYLIKGNHDLKQMSTKLKNLWADIKDYKEITDKNRKVILCHYPILCYKNSYKKDTYMLFGHVHNQTQESLFIKKCVSELKQNNLISDYPACNKGNLFNVGCMMSYMNYTPRTLDELIQVSKEQEDE